MDNPNSFDVVVIGAGIGGMLSACQLAQAGKSVMLVEKLSFLGGRFSGFKVNGVEVPSGAFHTIPHGENGPFDQALQRSGVELHVSNASVLASFHVDGKHIIAHNPFDILKIFPTLYEKFSVMQGLFKSWVNPDYQGSFGDWLDEIGMPDRVKSLYDRFCQFSLSTTVYDLPYVEGRKVTGMIFKYGSPGIPIGGAREVSRQLGLQARNSGVVIRKNTYVQNLHLKDNRICGVTLINRRGKETYIVETPLVISNAGPGNTIRMFKESGISTDLYGPISQTPPHPAIGLKLQILSPKSLLPHNSIMFCLDTQRIAGILQASNADPALAPPGKHLLISHQAIKLESDRMEERQLALKDWRYLFGSDFDNCEVLGSSYFPARFPVNWASQGHDLRDQIFAERGLWMVGDGMKPEGLMMVEGVAASAESVVRQILGINNTTPWEVSQLRVWARMFQKWGRSLINRNVS